MKSNSTASTSQWFAQFLQVVCIGITNLIWMVALRLKSTQACIIVELKFSAKTTCHKTHIFKSAL
jgi:hypothetical protein